MVGATPGPGLQTVPAQSSPTGVRGQPASFPQGHESLQVRPPQHREGDDLPTVTQQGRGRAGLGTWGPAPEQPGRLPRGAGASRPHAGRALWSGQAPPSSGPVTRGARNPRKRRRGFVWLHRDADWPVGQLQGLRTTLVKAASCVSGGAAVQSPRRGPGLGVLRLSATVLTRGRARWAPEGLSCVSLTLPRASPAGQALLSVGGLSREPDGPSRGEPPSEPREGGAAEAPTDSPRKQRSPPATSPPFNSHCPLPRPLPLRGERRRRDDTPTVRRAKWPPTVTRGSRGPVSVPVSLLAF